MLLNIWFILPKEGEYSKILNNCYLLGIDKDLIVAKRELRDKQVAVADTEKAIKKDPVFDSTILEKWCWIRCCWFRISNRWIK